MANGVITLQILFRKGAKIRVDFLVGRGQGFPAAALEISNVHTGDAMPGILQQLDQMGANVATMSGYENVHSLFLPN
jgi:hypothetical protein